MEAGSGLLRVFVMVVVVMVMMVVMMAMMVVAVMVVMMMGHLHGVGGGRSGVVGERRSGDHKS
jgi:uncharacterized membrane protein